MLTIKKSEMDKIGFDFAKAVDDYCAALTQHTKEEGTPAPVAADARIYDCVLRARAPGRADVFVPNWAVEDDTPPAPPPLTLDEKKAKLEDDMRKVAQDLAAAVSPPRKQLELQMRVNDAMQTAEKDRTADQVAILNLYAAMNKRVTAINWWLAAQLSAIDDLTDATVDAWKPEAPPS